MERKPLARVLDDWRESNESEGSLQNGGTLLRPPGCAQITVGEQSTMSDPSNRRTTHSVASAPVNVDETNAPLQSPLFQWVAEHYADVAIVWRKDGVPEGASRPPFIIIAADDTTTEEEIVDRLNIAF